MRRPAAFVRSILSCLLLVPLLGCSGDEEAPVAPSDRALASVSLTIPSGAEILGGFARAHHAPSGEGDVFTSWPPDENRVRLDLVVPPGESSWTFDLQGRLAVGADTTGNGLLFTAPRTIAGAAGSRIELSVVLDRVVPDPRVTNHSGVSYWISWPEIDRAVRYELLEAQGLLPDRVTELAGTDTVVLAEDLSGPAEYRVRARLRDGRLTAPSVPIFVRP